MRVRPLLILVLIALAIALLWLTRERPRQGPMPAPSPMPTSTVAPPSPAAPPTPSPAPPLERRSTVVLPWQSEPTPSPTAPEEEPTPRPGPSPTAGVGECVAVTYSSAGVVPGTLGGVLVDIRAENHCGRDLGPLEVWFWVGGFRYGDLVQSVRGHPFDPIPRDGEGKVTIVLPGSIDWYDRIEVQVTAPGAP